MNIKQTLRQLRQGTGLTQKAFAEHFSIPVSTYEQWEMEIRKPPEYVVKNDFHYIKLRVYTQR